MSLPSGTKLGSYEIVAPIGAGGMGEVYRARDSKLGREVAIKLLSDTVSANVESRARFEREARTLASLNHPGIVTIFAIEQANADSFIAMELVEGRPLSELIVRGGIKLDRLLSIAGQIAGAVAAAHKHGIVHRDLKPANVIVSAHDRVKVLDFGIAKLRAGTTDGETIPPTKQITGEGRIVGTVSYMSPEQAEGRAVDDRSDVFSLGVLLYEMATGERPFKGDTSISVLSAILKDTPKPITEIAPAVPKELARIVRRCLAKDADDRYQSAADLRSDLEDLRQSAISGELNSMPAAPSRPRGRMAAAVVVSLASLLGIGWALSRSTAGAPVAPVPNMSFSRLTLLGGVALYPMISPDGKWVVYVSNVSGNQDIYLQGTTGQTAINLTKDSPSNDTEPAFSPDGELIVFRSERDRGGLFVMGRTGESVRRLTRVGFQPAWFPDGRTIVFASVPVANAENRGGDVSELWVVNAGGGEPRRLMAGDAVQPRVSPRGLRIAYWSMPVKASGGGFTSANRDVWTVAADGTDPVRVTAHRATDWNPVWSPDGEWLYYLSNRAGSMNLWRVAIDESTGEPRGEPQALTAPASYVRHFTVSAGGTVGTFATQDAATNLGRIGFDPTTATTVGPIQALTTGPRDFGQFDISPDGTQLVASSSPRIQEDLFLMAADGSGMRSLITDGYRNRAPRWGANGQGIVFYSDRGQNYEVWSIDRDGSDLRQLTSTDGRRYFPVPSADGARTAASDISGWELFIHDARDYSRPPEKLPPIPEELRVTGGNLQPVAWSPDGGELLGHTTNLGPWIYSVASKTYRLLKLPGVTNARWLPDRNRIIGVRQGRVLVANVKTGESREVLSLQPDNVGFIALAPDAKWLYFNRATLSGDIWSVRFETPPSTSAEASTR